MKKSAKFDVVLFGASSFVGQILCAELFAQYGLKGSLRWAIAGRSKEKLELLRASLGAKAKYLPLLLADAADQPALRKLCAQSKVIVSTVGPYALYGEPLVKACAESGTDYCDLTGETQFIHRMLERYEAPAQSSGARIVPSCGFDSIPSDLGVHFLQAHAQQRYGAPCTKIQMRVRKLRGGFSGGTIGSILNVVKEASGDAQLRRGLSDPYWLCPPSARKRVRQSELRFARYDQAFKSWSAPFVMSGINTRIVQRSHALSPHAGQSDLLYDEAMLTGAGFAGRLKASGIAAGLAGFLVAAAVPPARWLLQTLVLPGPGAGPSPAAQLSGGYDLRFLGSTANGQTLRAQVTGDRDPGYGSTARMLCQAASCLALDVPDRPGGFWTPASLFGEKLIARLQAHAGLRFQLQDQ